MSKNIVPATKYDFVLFVRTPKGAVVELSVPKGAMSDEQKVLAAVMMKSAAAKFGRD